MKPTSGTTAFVRFEKTGQPLDDAEFCIEVIEKIKVMFLPGSKCFGEDFKGYVRIGFVCETEVLQQALEKLGAYVRENFA